MPGTVLPAPTLNEKQIAYFWTRVKRGGAGECWLWQGPPTPNGYGKIKLGGRWFGPHVLARWLASGEWPSGGLCTLHDCPGGDNRLCCNPAHLWLGTDLDNSRDMVLKGRARPGISSGEASGRAKLNEEQVVEIRRLHLAGSFTFADLARRFGVHAMTIKHVVARITWAHVP